MPSIGFLNEKGGSCKTTLSVHLAAHLAKRQGLKVLLCDLDPQGQVGKSLGFDVASMSPDMLDLLTDPGLSLEKASHPTDIDGLRIVPSNKGLVNFPLHVADAEDRYVRLVKKIRSEHDYDAIIFDAPPSMGLLSTNILVAADSVVVPVNCSYLALDGCAEVLASVERVKEELGNADLTVDAVVPTLYRKTRLADEIVSRLENAFGPSLTSILRYDVKVDEAQSHGRTVFDHARSSRGAKMLTTISEEIWSRVR